MKKSNFLYLGILCLMIGFMTACKTKKQDNTRQIVILDADWQFLNQDVGNGESLELNTASWETVNIPHDWAISGEFDINNDAYNVQILEDGDQKKQMRTGFTGGLPHVGVGWYRLSLDIPASAEGKRMHVEFDGVMSNAKVYLNGNYVGEWPYGYSSFGFDITKYIQFGGKNVLAVRAENLEHSSRWYPGAGIYRAVRMVVTSPVYVKQWGTYITTPRINEETGLVNIKTTILNKTGRSGDFTVETTIVSPGNQEVAVEQSQLFIESEATSEQILSVPNPVRWELTSPIRYTAITSIFQNQELLDKYSTDFGFRTFEFTTDSGFYLNEKRTELKGVCLHHDLGPLGAAVNESSLRHRMNLLQEMGCNAIRTAHNPPTPELLNLADEMGFLIIDEAFDEWEEPKVENGYSRLWKEWAEKDLVAMIHRDRNHPSIIMWSIGNEVREQKMEDGAENAKFLVNISHREDPTRPTTAGFNSRQPAIDNGLAAAVDVVGWNYEPKQYKSAHDQYPDFKVYGSETASTIGSRGIYKFPAVEQHEFESKPPYQLSAYGLSYPYWGNTPDFEFKAQDENLFMPGEFVWTGFDYLGEPTPFYAEWPSRSSYFGIIDLCGIPKDRYYLYQSKWSDKEVLHLLPHWNWQEGDTIPVHCFTNFNKAELFLNGKSLGVREKDPKNLYSTYRLIWEEVFFESGELKVVALDENNQPVKEFSRKTAGEPYAIRLEPDRTTVDGHGKELVFVTVSVIDKKGVVCPNADNLIQFSTEGSGFIRAVGNGDPTSLESFVKPFRKAFSGKCMVIVQAGNQKAEIVLTAKSEGLQSEKMMITVKVAIEK
ncbi:MAG: beta-galactosidase [Cyclobacteriaceae bacterium]|jgi:beta-galactosidase